MRRAWRWVKRIVLGALALVTVAVLVVLVLLHTDWGRDKIRARIETALAESFPGGARVGALEGSVFGTLTVRDVELRALDGSPAIRVATLDVEVELLPLARQRAVVESLVADGVRVTLGDSPLTKPAEPTPGEPSEPSAWSVELPAVEVRNGTFELAGGFPLQLDQLAATGALELPAGGALAGQLHVTATWRERAAPVDLTARLAIGDVVALPSITGTVGAVKLAATDIVVDVARPSGRLEVAGTAAAIEAVRPLAVPELGLPGDVSLVMIATPAGAADTELDLTAQVGAASLRGVVVGDPTALVARGYLSVSAPDLAQVSRGALAGHGEVALALAADRTGVRGLAGVRGATPEVPASHASVFLDAAWEPGRFPAGHARVTVLATSAGEIRTAAETQLAWTVEPAPEVWLERARVVATARDLAPVTRDSVLLSGRELHAELAVTRRARLVPELALAATGTFRAGGLVYDETRVRSVTGSFGATVTGAEVVGWARGTVRGAANAGEPLGDGTFDARYLRDERIYVAATARPAMADVEVVADAYVTLGDELDIALGEHRIAPKVGAAWAGRGGRVTVREDAIVVRGFTTASGTGSARLDARVGRATGALDATISARELPAAAIDARYAGTASGTLEVKRRGQRWDGRGAFTFADVVLAPDVPEVPVLDGEATVAVRGRDITLDARAKHPEIGAVRLQVELEGPRDLTDPRGWRRLERDAVRLATIDFEQVDLASVTPTGGRVAGKLTLLANDTKGTLEVAGVETPVGPAEGQVTFTQLGKDISAVWNADVRDLGATTVVVQAAIPDRPFDPAVWQALGRNVLRAASITVDQVTVDPEKLAALGFDAPYSGTANLDLKVGPGAEEARIAVDVLAVEGDPLVRPVDLHLEAKADARETIATACLAPAYDKRGDPCEDGDGGRGFFTASHPRIAYVERLVAPVDLATWLTAPKTALTATLRGELVIPQQSAPELFALVGRADFDPRKGTIEGSVAVGGTLGKPTGEAKLALRSLDLISSIAGRDIPELKDLTVTATWDGDLAKAELVANEASERVGVMNLDRKLAVRAQARVSDLAAGTASMYATNFDLAPLAAFLPGELAASAGKLRAAFTVQGLGDLEKSRIRGDLHIEQAYVPINPIIGSLREGQVDLYVLDRGIELKARGILNVCRVVDPKRKRCVENVRLQLDAPNDLSRIDGDLVLAKVSTIGEWEPIIDGKARIALRRTARKLTGDITIRGASVYVPPSVGDDLLEADDPSDVFFIEKPPPADLSEAFRRAREPEEPWLVANVDLGPMEIQSEEFDVVATVRSSGLKVLVGDTVGLDGAITLDRGVVNNISGRQYQIAQQDILRFDGTIDPEVDLEISHRFPELELVMVVQGRLSDDTFPNPSFYARETNTPYTKDQLIGFMLGGSPASGADATATTTQSLVNAGTAQVSDRLVRRLRTVLPKQLNLDVIKCEPGTSLAGSSCTFGKRFFDGDVYVAYRRRLQPQPNENQDEGQLQYYLSREWYLEGVGGGQNIWGADLLWRRRW